MSRIAEFPETLDERQKEIAERIKSGPRGRIRGPLALWLYSADLAERAQHLGAFLRFGTAFDKRLSELIILTVSRHIDCEYVWSIHAPIAVNAGLDSSVVEALRTGTRPVFANNDEQTVYEFTTQLLQKNRADQDRFDALIKLFGERGVVELTAIMGYYSMGAYLLNAVEISTPDGSKPFK